MSYQALARKYRPNSFTELVGQTAVRTALENALDQGRMHPALLLSGTRGVGKTTLGRIVARALNCEQGMSSKPCGECGACVEIEQGRFVDLQEIDAASRTKVDETRELLDNVQYAPTRGRYKVYLIDEVHMLSKHSFNALLKTLEEPPPHTQFLLATTDPQKLPVTILSRCLQFHLKRIPTDAIADRLRHILELEQIEADSDGVERLARAADGSLRDALSLLDQAIAHGGGVLSGVSVAEMLGSIERRDVIAIVEALADNAPEAAWAAVERIAEQGLDFSEALDELARLWQRLAVVQLLPAQADDAAELGPLAGRFEAADIQVYYQIAVHARRDQDWAPDPRSGFEMCVLRLFAFLPADHETPPAGRAAPRRAPRVKPAPATGSDTADDAPTPSRGPVPPPAAEWPQILECLQLRGPALQLARHCVMESRDQQSLHLALDEAGHNMRTESAEARLREAVAEALGLELRIGARPGAETEAVKTPEQLRQEAIERRQREATEEFMNDATVRELTAEFGAEVLADTIRPLDADGGDNEDTR